MCKLRIWLIFNVQNYIFVDAHHHPCIYATWIQNCWVVMFCTWGIKKRKSEWGGVCEWTWGQVKVSVWIIVHGEETCCSTYLLCCVYNYLFFMFVIFSFFSYTVPLSCFLWCCKCLGSCQFLNFPVFKFDWFTLWIGLNVNGIMQIFPPRSFLFLFILFHFPLFFWEGWDMWGTDAL